MASPTSGMSVNELLDAQELQEAVRAKKTVSAISSILLQTVGILVWIALSLTIFPWLYASYSINSELWGFVAKRVEMARKVAPQNMVTFPYSSWQVAMSLTGWFPGMYTSIFFGSGPRSMIPLILFYSCVSPVKNSDGQAMSFVSSSDPAKFAAMLGNLDRAFEDEKTNKGESPEMAVLCRAWELAGESFSSCTPPKVGSGCNAGSIAMSAITGGAAGGFAGKTAAQAFKLESAGPTGIVAAILFAAGSGIASAASQGCF